MPKMMAGGAQKKAVQKGKQAGGGGGGGGGASMGPTSTSSRKSNAGAENLKKVRASHLIVKQQEEPQEDLLPIHHPRFLAFIYIAILVNALQMGLQVDINGGAWDVVWKILDHIFTFIFAAEMGIKLYYLRRNYFFDKWNVLDFFIAWSSILDSWIIPLATGGGGGIVLRIFQFLRLLRMVKVLRMRRDLLALIEGIIASMRSMFWVSLLLLLVIYTAAILCVAMVGSESHAEEYAEFEMDNVFEFGTLRRAMLTLFSISILDNWSDIVTPVAEVQPYMLPFFLLFLVTTSFGLMNALIGIIVEQTTAATAKMEAMDEAARRQEQLGRVTDLIDVVSKIDDSGDGMISIEEMEAAKDNEDLNRILRSIDLPPGFTVSDLHLMLDENGNGTMSQEEFVEGMYQLIFCNEFQSQCVAKLSVAQIKKCVFELRQDMFQEMKIMSQQVFAMQKVILGEDAFGPSPDAGSSQDQAASGFFADKKEIDPIKKVPIRTDSAGELTTQQDAKEEPKSSNAGSPTMKAEKSITSRTKAKAIGKAEVSSDTADADAEPSDGGERKQRRRRNSGAKLKKKGSGERGYENLDDTVEGDAEFSPTKSEREKE